VGGLQQRGRFARVHGRVIEIHFGQFSTPIWIALVERQRTRRRLVLRQG
jgi:hypothetical protein